MPVEKNPVLALLLSLLTGLGQLYNGEESKGVTLLVVGIVLFAVSVVTVVLFVVSVPFWIYGMYDAYARANVYNHSLRTTGRPPW
jgi:TM2 domain-containing membrane protein YozV